MEDIKTFQPIISDYFAGLNEETVNEIVSQYHNKEVKIKDIITRYGLQNIYVGDFKEHLPPTICYDYICPDCMVYSCTKPIGRGKQSLPFCPKCDTYMYSEYDAKIIHAERALKESQIKELNLHPVIDRGNTIPFQIITKDLFASFDFESKVFIGAIASNCMSANICSVQSWQIKKMKFYPQPSMQHEIMYHLNLINDGVDKVNIEIENELVIALQNPTGTFDSTIQERFELWKKVALAEVSEIFRNEMHECNFFGYHEENVDQFLYSLLEDYSVAQIINIVWRSVRKAATDYCRTDNRAYAANKVLNHCQKYVSYKKDKKELIGDYSRPRYCPQSKISKYYFDSVLKIGEKGFKEVPSPFHLMR